DREVRRQRVIRAPFADGADQVRLGGLLGHGGRILRAAAASARVLFPGARPAGIRYRLSCYFLIPRSADVRASENAGRANRRSAYFMSGAACLPIGMP